MKIKLQTEEQVTAFIDKANLLLGYPNLENGTLTYTDVPELTEIKDEEENVIDSYFEIEVTYEINKAMLEIALEHMV